MTIRCGWTESRAAKRLEPVIHLLAQSFPLAQAVAGLFLEIFNPIGFGNFCYIASYPPFCRLFDNCSRTRGRQAKLLYTLFSVIPELVSLAVIYVSIILIYCKVRLQGNRALAISANQELVRAKVKAVAVQSWLFAIIFSITWFFSALVPLMGIAIEQVTRVIRAEYILTILTTTFLPLQGFFNFCIYIRPRFLRLRAEYQLSLGKALISAIFGGRETFATRRRSYFLHPRRRNSTTSASQSRSFAARQETIVKADPLDVVAPSNLEVREPDASDDSEVRQPADSIDPDTIDLDESQRGCIYAVVN